MEITGCFIAQPLLQSIMQMLDPFKDDSKRSEGFVNLFVLLCFAFVMAPGCYRGALIL